MGEPVEDEVRQGFVGLRKTRLDPRLTGIEAVHPIENSLFKRGMLIGVETAKQRVLDDSRL